MVEHVMMEALLFVVGVLMCTRYGCKESRQTNALRYFRSIRNTACIVFVQLLVQVFHPVLY